MGQRPAAGSSRWAPYNNSNDNNSNNNNDDNNNNNIATTNNKNDSCYNYNMIKNKEQRN